jgi:Ni,Fe-hydrogenase III small subunit
MFPRQGFVPSGRESRDVLARAQVRGDEIVCKPVADSTAGGISPAVASKGRLPQGHSFARFGVHFVASQCYTDALLVTGPVGRAMQEPLQRCFDAMAEPRIVIAVGTCAISGGMHRDEYADADGVNDYYPIAAYVPGSRPHPWSIIHGILLAMWREIS